MYADEVMKIPHSPAPMLASALFSRPWYVNQPSFTPRASISIILTPNAPLIWSVVASPSKPLLWSAKGWSCQACMFSASTHDGQAELDGHFTPAAWSFLAIASISSQVAGALSGSPAFLKRSLL
jgi:hypothetical protein